MKPRKKVQKRVRRSPEDARRLILDAAEMTVGVQGPAGLRLQDVARAAGVSHPTILHHFGSREGLIRALNSRAAEELTRSLLGRLNEGRMGQGGSGGGGIAQVFDAYRNGLAERTVWLIQSGAMPKPAKSSLLGEVMEAMQAQRRKLARPEHAPDIADTRHVVNLVAVAALGDALIGDQLRAESGAPEDDARQAFERFLAGLIDAFFRAKAEG